MRALPLRMVRVGVRNDWLLVSGVDAWVEAGGRGRLDVLAYLLDLNGRLPCPSLPEGELVKMVPGVVQWGAKREAYLRRGLRSVDSPPVEVQARRGRRSGRVRRGKRAMRDADIGRRLAAGEGKRAVASAVGVSTRTVDRALARLDAAQGRKAQ